MTANSVSQILLCGRVPRCASRATKMNFDIKVITYFVAQVELKGLNSGAGVFVSFKRLCCKGIISLIHLVCSGPHMPSAWFVEKQKANLGTATCGLHSMLRLSSLVSENTVYFSFKWGIKFYFHNRHSAKIYHHLCFFHLVRKKKC